MNDLPSIPALPISYSDAYQILSRLSGPIVPNEWQGSLNLKYRFGPGFENNHLKLRINVNSNFVNR